MTVGYYIAILKFSNNEEITLSDFFRGFYYLPQLTLYYFTIILIPVGITILSVYSAESASPPMSIILPPVLGISAIYLSIAYMFAPLFIVDMGMNFWQSLENSRRIVTKRWFQFLGLLIVLIPINALGIVTLGLGLLITIPLSFCIIAVAYHDIVHHQLKLAEIAEKGRYG